MTSAYLQGLYHSGERAVAHGPLVVDFVAACLFDFVLVLNMCCFVLSFYIIKALSDSLVLVN